MTVFAADALALVGPSGVATIRRFTGAGCIYLLIHAKRHVFRVYFESLSNKGQRIYVEAETLNDNLHALVPVFEGLESSRSWSKVLRQIAQFESTGGYLDSFMLEEQRWEDEREEREERRRREQQQGEDEDDDVARRKRGARSAASRRTRRAIARRIAAFSSSASASKPCVPARARASARESLSKNDRVR